MNANIMNELNNIYIKILKEGRNQYESSSQHISIKNAQKLESYSTYLGEMNEKLETLLDLTDKYANECLDKATEIRQTIDLNNKYEGDPSQMFLMHKEMFNGMSWADITEKEEKKEKIINDVNSTIKNDDLIKKDFEFTPIIYKNITDVYGKDIGFKFQIPIINKLNEMPASLYWYNGDDTNHAGIYTCITRGFYVRVPLPNVYDSSQNFNRTGSIKCKNETLEECRKIREDLSNRYNSDIRDCTFAHRGDNYIKVGTTFRCPHLPRFGNHSYIKEDLDNVPDSDIKMILMYSLSDILLTSLWFQKQKEHANKNITFTDVDIC